MEDVSPSITIITLMQTEQTPHSEDKLSRLDKNTVPGQYGIYLNTKNYLINNYNFFSVFYVASLY